MDATRILTTGEIDAVLADLAKRIKRAPSQWQNLIVFRLSCCCGLRRAEIAGLTFGDINVAGPRPCIRVRKEIAKGKKKGRIVPLWWDKATLQDVATWRATAASHPSVPVIRRRSGLPMKPAEVAKRWQTAIKSLSPGRIAQLSIHAGRHTFCSYALAAGRSLVEVRDAAGHRNISTTSIYLHCVQRENVPDVFNFRR